ncbi:MBL fold metallo-hydrolase [Phenylobacterium sp.]|uniref:MBL fold metallo-hydrolase n=1 Tax=Phenylobacterium sp. TaxID=1871053 RepID=UPI002BCE8982|nr:MBL fold metallo-hydrolase [Phenylobacterium sp.]HLZ73769.1 MBL fold metallo-hydrolase [Phenylobacterium sp.]
MPSIAVRTMLAAALISAGASAALAQAPGAPPAASAPRPPLVVKPVKPGLFMIVGAGGNTTVRVTDDGLILVDSKNPGQSIYDEIVADAHTISPKPIKYLIDTHMHADHTGNNGRFEAAGVKVVGQKNIGVQLAKFTPPPNNPAAQAPASPDVTYDKTYEIKLGGKTVKLNHFAPAHTDGDTVVYFPDLKVVSMGDELVAVTPNCDYGGGGSITGWLSSLDQTLKLDWDLAIPGHGDTPLTKADMKAFRDKWATFLDRARAAVKAGATKDRLVAAIKTDDLWTFNPNAWTGARLDGLYAEAGGK